MILLAAGLEAADEESVDPLPRTPSPNGMVAEEVSAWEDVNASNVPPASAEALLRDTIARLPVAPLKISGILIVRRQRGIVLRELPFSMLLEWGANPPRATYEVRDPSGRFSPVLEVLRPDGQTAVTRWRDASGRTLSQPPALDAYIFGSDVTWLDLTLDFLWWPEAELAGSETFRGSLCDIVVVKPPEPMPACAAMRLWIDRRLRFIRQVEQLDRNGDPIRRMWVSSVGKSGDRWMIRNMEIDRRGSGHRTKLHVEVFGPP